jgi:two-component system response regulator MtrA
MTWNDMPMKGRVLVVDDDAALAEMLGIVLRGEGFEPTFVSDGDKALEAFREARPDLVLLDLMLPGTTCAARSARNPGCPSSC